MSLPEPSYHTRTSPEYSNTADAQGKDLKTHIKKLIEVLKEKINKSIKESQEKQIIEGNNQHCSRPENGNGSNKENTK